MTQHNPNLASRDSALTVADLAQAKRLPGPYLLQLGLHTLPDQGVGIPYYDFDGREIAVKRRTALKARDGSWWPKGQSLAAYGLWKLDDARRFTFLVLVEGESDCWAAWHHQLPALGIPGAQAAHTLTARALDGVTTVYVVRETDRGGEQFVANVVKRLSQLGYRGRLFELRCPDAIKDLADLHVRNPLYFPDQFEKAVRASTPLTVPDLAASPSPVRPPSGLAPGPESFGLATTELSSIRPEPVRWLVPGYLPLGKLVLLAGDGGHGKSTLTLHLAACLSTGRPCLGLDYEPPRPAEALVVSCEDDFADTVVPRLLAQGADLARIRRVDGLCGPDDKPLPFCLAHCQAVEEELAARPDVRLVVIDPAGAYIGRSGVDDYRDSDLRTLLGPLAELASRRQVTIVLVKHLVKGATAKAVQRVNGSAGYINTVRVAHLVAPHPDDETRKLLLPAKINIGPKPATRAFRLLPLSADEQALALAGYADHLGEADRAQLGGQMLRVAWLGVDPLDADAAFREPARPTPLFPSDRERAAAWLAEFLAGGPRPSRECVDRGNAELNTNHSLSWWRTDILKARLRGQSRRTNRERSPRWWFTLPCHPWPYPGLEEVEGSEGERENGEVSLPPEGVTSS